MLGDFNIDRCFISSDSENLCISNDRGFVIFNLDPFKNKCAFVDVNKSIRIIASCSTSDYVVFSGKSDQKGFDDKSICVFDCNIGHPVTHGNFDDVVLKLLLMDDMFFVVLKNSVKIYSINTSRIINFIKGAENEMAPFDVATIGENIFVATTGKTANDMKIVNIDQDKKDFVEFNCHTHPVSNAKFSKDGSMLATSSEQGTIIRLFNTSTGDKLSEFRRGTFHARILDMAISPDNYVLAVMSSHNTIHFFDIKKGSADTQQKSFLSYKASDGRCKFINYASKNQLHILTCSGNIVKLTMNDKMDTISDDLYISLR